MIPVWQFATTRLTNVILISYRSDNCILIFMIGTFLMLWMRMSKMLWIVSYHNDIWLMLIRNIGSSTLLTSATLLFSIGLVKLSLRKILTSRYRRSSIFWEQSALSGFSLYLIFHAYVLVLELLWLMDTWLLIILVWYPTIGICIFVQS